LGPDLRYFATTLRDKGCRSGVPVGLASLAEREENATAGFYHMTAALHESVTILVVTREDFLTLNSVAGFVNCRPWCEIKWAAAGGVVSGPSRWRKQRSHEPPLQICWSGAAESRKNDPRIHRQSYIPIEPQN